MRRRQPISMSRPRAISVNGKVCATKATPDGDSNWNASTWRAKFAMFTEMENFRTKRGHRFVLGRKTFE